MIASKVTSSSETLSTHAHTVSVQRKTKKRVEGRTRGNSALVGRGPALVPHPQVIASDEALPARAKYVIPIVVSQHVSFVHPSATIAQVRSLRISEVRPETLYIT